MRRWSCWYVVLALGLASLAGCSSSTGGGGPTPDGGGRLQGNLGSENAGATVSLDGTDLRATVGADGSFTLENVPPGEYTLAVDAGGSEGGAVLCRVVDGEVTNIGRVDITVGGQISGLVTIASRQEGPIEGARVTVRMTEDIWSYGDVTDPGLLDDIAESGGSPNMMDSRQDEDGVSYPPRTVYTDEDGAFHLTGLPMGPYLVSIEADGYETAETATWVSPGMTSPVDAQLVFIDPNNASLTGRMTTTENGETVPLAYVVVDLWPTSIGARAGRAEGCEECDDNGQGGGDDGNGDVEDGTDDGGGQGEGGGDGEQVELGAGAENGGGEKYGYGFEDGAGEPGMAPPIDIDPWCLPPWRYGKQALTDENGEFSITNIEPGEYVVNIWRFGYESRQEIITLDEREHETLNALLESILAVVSGTVYGRAEDGSVEPLAGAWVSGYAQTWDPWVVGAEDAANGARRQETTANYGWAETDEHGHYEMTIEAGNVWVEAWADGYWYSSTEFDLSTAGATGVDLILERDESNGGGTETRPD